MGKRKSIVIKLLKVTKKYYIHHEKPTLVEHLIKGKNETFIALDKINLEVFRGEKVGIIGKNGAGKTTLLKVITGITSPTSGRVHTEGRIVSLIDLEAGFHPDFTGEQNVYLNGTLIGMKKEEIRAKLNDIIDFADIGQFIDVPLYTYSKGMKLRLGFAISVFANPDTLILDESMAVGDEDFQKKSEAKIQEFFLMGKTVVVATHWMDFIRRNCHRVLIVDKGRIVADGDTKLVDKYKRMYKDS